MKFESFLKWWLLFTLLVVATIFCNYLGLLKTLWQKDASYLSVTTLVLFFIMSCKCGRDIFFLESKKEYNLETIQSFRRKEEIIWFSSEVCLNLGMLGTIVGFCMMLVGFENLDISNQQTVQGLLAELGKSMATALYTTLVGLLCGQLLKIQAFVLSLHLNKLEQKQETK